MLTQKILSLKKILGFSLIVLFIGQFDSMFFGSIPLMVLSIIGAIVFSILNPKYYSQNFSLVMILLILSHFRIGDVFGSLAGILGFVLIILVLIKGRSINELKLGDKNVNFFIFILILSNIIGWMFKSALRADSLFLGVIGFVSIIMIFYVAKNLTLSWRKLNILVSIVVIFSFWGLISSIVNGLNLSPFKTPILGGHFYILEQDNNLVNSEPGKSFVSMIDRPSGEFGIIYFAFLFTIYLFYEKLNGLLSFSKRAIFLSSISAFLLCILEFSKSHTVVIGVALIIIPMFSGLILRAKTNLNIFKTLGIVIIIAAFIVSTMSIFRFDYILYRFKQQPELFNNLMENPLTAEGTSRSDSWGLAYEYISNNNFFIGYGYANGGKNSIAWLGPDNVGYAKLDYHNLIYSLIPVFGWFGSIAFLMIILITLIRLWKLSTHSKFILSYRIIGLALFYFIGFFMLGELSITALTTPNYMILIFIFLGVSNSVYFNRYKYLVTK